MALARRSDERSFNHKEIPSHFRESTTYIYSVRFSNGVSKTGFPEGDANVESFLWQARQKKRKILFLRIKDGEDWVMFENVPNCPQPHTPEWYDLQEF